MSEVGAGIMPSRSATVQVGVIAAAVGAGLVAGGHWSYVATAALIHAIAAAGLALVVARAGFVSLGHAAFYAIGAYTTGVLTRDHGWPIGLGIVAAFAVGLATGAVVGRCALRTRGIAFVMVTLAAGEVVRVFGQQARGITGGDTGLSSIPALSSTGATIVAAAILAAVLASTGWLLATTFGRSVDAARQDETKAAALGYHVTAARTVTFMISAGIVAIAGALLAHHATFVSPSLARWSMSGQLLVMVLIGGGRSVTGAAVAAVGFTYLEDFVVSRSDHWDLVLGGLFIGVVLVGLVGHGQPVGLRALSRRWSLRRRRVAVPR